jgi:hypothetical protein
MVVFGGGSPRSMLVYGVVSIAILAFSYFVIIKPITDSTNDTVNSAIQQTNQALKHSFNNPANSGGGGGATKSSGSGSSASTSAGSSSGGSATAASVYNACIDAINGNAAGKPGCVAAKNAFQQCSDQAASLSGSAKSTAVDACQTAAKQTVAALNSAG